MNFSSAVPFMLRASASAKNEYAAFEERCRELYTKAVGENDKDSAELLINLAKAACLSVEHLWTWSDKSEHQKRLCEIAAGQEWWPRLYYLTHDRDEMVDQMILDLGVGSTLPRRRASRKRPANDDLRKLIDCLAGIETRRLLKNGVVVPSLTWGTMAEWATWASQYSFQAYKDQPQLLEKLCQPRVRKLKERKSERTKRAAISTPSWWAEQEKLGLIVTREKQKLELSLLKTRPSPAKLREVILERLSTILRPPPS